MNVQADYLNDHWIPIMNDFIEGILGQFLPNPIDDF